MTAAFVFLAGVLVGGLLKIWGRVEYWQTRCLHAERALEIKDDLR